MAKGVAEIAHGPMFIGTALNTILYGIMITQTYLYYSNYKRDRKWIKILVATLFVADTANTIFDLVYLYNSVIVNFANPTYLATATWLVATDPALTGIITCLVQCFFAWRVKVLTGNNWIVGIIVITAVSTMLGGLGTAIGVKLVPVFSEFQRTKQIVIVWLVSSALGDLVISTTLVTHLRKHRTGFPATDDIVNRLIRFTVQTGLVTSIVATLDLIFFLVDSSGTHLLFNYPLCKLYTNTLMSSLNSRSGWSFSQPNSEGQTTSGTISGLSFPRSQPKVVVHVESHQMRDAPDTKPREYGGNATYDVEAGPGGLHHTGSKTDYTKSDISFS